MRAHGIIQLFNRYSHVAYKKAAISDSANCPFTRIDMESRLDLPEIGPIPT